MMLTALFKLVFIRIFSIILLFTLLSGEAFADIASKAVCNLLAT